METDQRLKPTISIEPELGNSPLIHSPSRDSVTTEVSLMSVADPKTNLRVSFGSRSEVQLARGPSPTPHGFDRLAVPRQGGRPGSAQGQAQPVKDIWLDEENDLIRSCGALSKALGLQKSFSTSDIIHCFPQENRLRATRSDMYLLECSGLTWGRLDANSRSLSTWVAVGDVQSSTSQLPSPQVEMTKGFPCADYGPTFTAADLIRSVNKKVRQNYIRRRLKVTYKALEQFSESEFDLDRLEENVKKTRQSQNLETILVTAPGLPGAPVSRSTATTKAASHVTQALETVQADLGLPGLVNPDKVIVSPKEIERDRGKPLSKYERNIMIFDWLHTLDETATFDVAALPT